ncbi:hypothetical protein X772_28810 [Mesorhizobium sp. LSJC280B00]|nr:hypothetical protein X772_28810 [Mesorhizobium sp. LSJC280B00]
MIDAGQRVLNAVYKPVGMKTAAMGEGQRGDESCGGCQGESAEE